MARGQKASTGRSARSEASNPEKGLPKSFDSVLDPSDFAYERADERTYRAFNSTKEEFESMINSNEMQVMDNKSFTKTATVKGETVKIERVFYRTLNELDSQNNSGYGVRESYTVTKNGKEVAFWTHYGINA
jgi:hypothetical protein